MCVLCDCISFYFILYRDNSKRMKVNAKANVKFSGNWCCTCIKLHAIEKLYLRALVYLFSLVVSLMYQKWANVLHCLNSRWAIFSTSFFCLFTSLNDSLQCDKCWPIIATVAIIIVISFNFHIKIFILICIFLFVCSFVSFILLPTP